MRIASVFLGVAVLVGCEPDAQRVAGLEQHPQTTEQSAVAPPDLVEERTSLLEADRSYSAASASTSLIEGVVGMLAEDAIVFLPTGVVQGREAIRGRMATSASNRTSRLTWTPIRADVSRDGTQGYTYGYSEQVLADGRAFVGKYISYWRRAATGEWQVVAYKRLLREPGDVSAEPPIGFRTPDYRRYRSFAPADSATLFEDVAATDRAFAATSNASGPAVAFGRYIASDGALLGPFSSFTFGAQAAMKLYEGVGPGEMVWQPRFGGVAGSGDLAFTIGDAELRQRLEDGSLSEPFIVWYMSVWKRQRTGEWRFVIDG